MKRTYVILLKKIRENLKQNKKKIDVKQYVRFEIFFKNNEFKQFLFFVLDSKIKVLWIS